MNFLSFFAKGLNNLSYKFTQRKLDKIIHILNRSLNHELYTYLNKKTVHSSWIDFFYNNPILYRHILIAVDYSSYKYDQNKEWALSVLEHDYMLFKQIISHIEISSIDDELLNNIVNLKDAKFMFLLRHFKDSSSMNFKETHISSILTRILNIHPYYLLGDSSYWVENFIKTYKIAIPNYWWDVLYQKDLAVNIYNMLNSSYQFHWLNTYSELDFLKQRWSILKHSTNAYTYSALKGSTMGWDLDEIKDAIKCNKQDIMLDIYNGLYAYEYYYNQRLDVFKEIVYNEGRDFYLMAQLNDSPQQMIDYLMYPIKKIDIIEHNFIFEG